MKKKPFSLTESQKRKFEELISASQILVHETELFNIDLQAVWIIGGVLRDILLFENPPVHNYDFYFQLQAMSDIYPWLSFLEEHAIPYKVVGVETEHSCFHEELVFQVINLSLLQFGVDYEINIFVGSLAPEEFLYEYVPVGISLLGLDLAQVFKLWLEKKESEKILKKIWRSEEFKKDVKTRKIRLRKNEWLGYSKNYPLLEAYLGNISHKLSEIGFNE